MTRKGGCARIGKCSYLGHCACQNLTSLIIAWEPPDFIRDVGVAGSNPVTPTILLRVYSGDIGNRLFRRHRGHFSTERIFGAFHPPVLLVEKAQVVVHKAHQPDPLADLFDPDPLSGKYAAQVDLASSEADTPAARDQDGAVVEGILQLPQIPARLRNSNHCTPS